MLKPIALRSAALMLIGMSAAMVLIALVRKPEVLRQPGSGTILLEFGALLCIYTTAAFFCPGLLRGSRAAACREGILFGLLTGAIEILNLVLETWRPDLSVGVVSIAFMLGVFLLWGVAAARAARSSGSIGFGVCAAIVSAGLCMLIAVNAGFLIELFVKVPDPAAVSQWAEFTRSGWTDVRSFALANTVESGSTHLFIAPLVAVVFGVGGSFLATLRVR